ncbi:MAG: DUF3310 domain-containing protein [bacterium]
MEKMGSQHYKQGTIEPLNVMEDTMSASQYQGFLLGNILKYPLRHNHVPPSQRIPDLKKCIHYCLLLERSIVEEEEEK